MIEMGTHAETHIIPRLKKVINGDDSGGITESSKWQGGGGFRFCKLAPSLLEKSILGRPVLNKEYNEEMLQEALCKLEGFTYIAPSERESWWNHGYSSDRDFAYVTTSTLSRAQLAALSDEVGSTRSLLVFCGAFTCDTSDFENLTVKKIPKAILSKHEWDQDDYSLKPMNKRKPARV